jgi:hypothetical protein
VRKKGFWGGRYVSLLSIMSWLMGRINALSR